MSEAYFELAKNTFLSNLVFPFNLPYVEKVMLSSMISYNKLLMGLIVLSGIMLAMLVNMIFGYSVYILIRKFISQKGLNNMMSSSAFFYKYCLFFCPVLSMISPFLIIVFSGLCGFLKLFRWRIFLAISFEFLSDFIRFIF